MAAVGLGQARTSSRTSERTPFTAGDLRRSCPVGLCAFRPSAYGAGMRIQGEYKGSRNAANHEGGGLHLDANAVKLGFARGGAVAGSIHLDLFSPLVLEAFGEAWFETGSLSMRYKTPTVDGDLVRGTIEDGRAWIERDDGTLIGEGSVGVGDGPTALRSLDLHEHALAQPKILEGVAPGDELPTVTRHISGERQRRLLDDGLVTEVLDRHRGDGAVVVPQSFVHELHQAATAHLDPLVESNGGALGMFGALEIANVNGPLTVDRDYEMRTRILAIGESPKTEHAWFEVTAHDGATHVATLFMQQRWMKGSSPRYS